MQKVAFGIMGFKKLDLNDIQQILEDRFVNDTFFSLKDLPHPFLLKDAKKGAEIVADAVCNNKKILIVGDYDVDGVMASIVMMKFFEIIQYQKVSFVIPNRFFDGYGVSPQLIEKNETDLIITVDNGVTAIDAGQFCLEKNIKLIITDHHVPSDVLPSCDALINPQQKDCSFPQKNICGAAVAWYFCNALKIILNKKVSLRGLLKFVALASIADMMPLTHINKLFVREGLEQLRDSEELSDLLLKSLFKAKKFNSQDVSFNIIPLLNSAGRINDASIVCDFFLKKEEKEIEKIFLTLKDLNKQRKKLTQQTFEESHDCLKQNDHCVVAYKKEWSDGVIGIVATRLVDLYHKAAFVFTYKGDGIIKGSGRSDGKINLFETLLPYQDCFIHFGGHAEAVGISLKETDLENFLQIFKEPLFILTDEHTEQHQEILGYLDIRDINARLFNLIHQFEPYGQGNPMPHFIIQGARVLRVSVLKSQHQKIEFEGGIYGIEFFSKEFFKEGDCLNFQCVLQENLFDTKPNLIIKDVSLCHL